MTNLIGKDSTFLLNLDIYCFLKNKFILLKTAFLIENLSFQNVISINKQFAWHNFILFHLGVFMKWRCFYFIN